MCSFLPQAPGLSGCAHQECHTCAHPDTPLILQQYAEHLISVRHDARTQGHKDEYDRVPDLRGNRARYTDPTLYERVALLQREVGTVREVVLKMVPLCCILNERKGIPNQKKRVIKKFPEDETAHKRYTIFQESRERSREDHRLRMTSSNGRENESGPVSGDRLLKAFAKGSGFLRKVKIQSTGL